MAVVLLSVPTSQISQRPTVIGNSWSHGPASSIILPSKPLIPFCSSSSSPSSVVENDPSPSPPADSVPSQLESSMEESATFPPRGCKACGRGEVEKGCNGEGRIQGGIATIPGFGWWPIKAYRPCPGFVASGGRYRRRGQSMDDL